MKKWVKVLSFIVFIQVSEQSNAFFDDFNYDSDYYEAIAYENTINSVTGNKDKKIIIITTGPVEPLKD